MGFQSRKFHGVQHEVTTSKSSTRTGNGILKIEEKCVPHQCRPWIPEIKLPSPSNLKIRERKVRCWGRAFPLGKENFK
jgi:hypothetical protein